MAHDAVHDLFQLEPSDENRTVLMRPRVPRSKDTIHAFHIFRLSDEDQTIAMCPRGAHDWRNRDGSRPFDEALCSLC